MPSVLSIEVPVFTLLPQPYIYPSSAMNCSFVKDPTSFTGHPLNFWDLGEFVALLTRLVDDWDPLDLGPGDADFPQMLRVARTVWNETMRCQTEGCKVLLLWGTDSVCPRAATATLEIAIHPAMTVRHMNGMIPAHAVRASPEKRQGIASPGRSVSCPGRD